MRNKGLRRFQLFLLFVAAMLIVWRMVASPAGVGFVTMSDLDERELTSQYFEVLTPATVTISGEVSFEDDRVGSDLAVVAWILGGASGDVVWRTRVDNVQREGVRAMVEDSVRLEAGDYAVYFSTLGPDNRSYREGSAFGLKPHWTNYKDFWHLDLQAPDGSVDVDPKMRLTSVGGETSLFQMDLRARRSSQQLMIHASRSSTLRAFGGFTRCNGDCDRITIKEIPDGVVVWSVENEEAEAGGGSRVNHWLYTTVELEGGVYEIEFIPGRHEGAWSENPPWRADDFIFRMDPASAGTIRPIDPWAFGQPIVEHLGLGDGELRRTRITLEDSLDVILYAMGEIGGQDQRYDWGWIEREGGASDVVWEMTYDNTLPAGGDSDNRLAKAIFRLGPGSYVASFETDGSHSYAGFNRGQPRNPERWGLAVFPLDPDQLTSANVQTETTERPVQESDWPSPAGSMIEDVDASRFLVRSTRLGKSADVTTDFTLSDSTDVILMALGELTSTANYDYGWLEDRVSGETIWRMEWNTTLPAGGDDSYRRAHVELTLPPGSYRARFTTDGSISWEGFGDEAPDYPEDWGIAIFTADS